MAHLVTTRSTRILSADVAASVLLHRPGLVLEQKPLAALIAIEERSEFRNRVAELPAGGTIDGWRLSFRGLGGASIPVVASVRAGSDEEAGRRLWWTLVADQATGTLEDGMGVPPDISRELRQLAHELNQPLAAIVTYVRGTQMRLDSKTLSEADLRAALEVIVNEAMRATAIVRALDRRKGRSS